MTIILSPSPGTVQEVGFVSGSLHMSLVNRVGSVSEIWPRHFFFFVTILIGRPARILV